MAIWRIEKVKVELGYRSNTSVYGAIRDNLFTKPVKICRRSVGWPDNEVNAICGARIAGYSDEQIRSLVQKLHNDRGLLVLES